MSIDARSRAWVEVDTRALRANYDTLRGRVGPAPALIPMVKADGYGLGVERVVGTLEPLNPWGYGVATVDEGRRLRRLGVERPVLVFSPMPPQAVQAAAAAGLTACVSDLDALARWAEAAGADAPLDFHVEVDTGMGRAGFDWRAAEEWGEGVRRFTGPALRWTGIFTHFHGADSPDPAPTTEQWRRFRDALERLPVDADARMLHAANSAAALRWPEYALDAVRPGIYLYGGHPATALGPDAVPPPRPVVAVRARLAHVKMVPPGHTVGYGARYTAGTRERWGTIDIGYGDGLPRLLGNRGSALVRGREVPMIGRISMDMTVIDLSDSPETAVGDVVTLIGRDGDAEITVEQVAALADTISYEVLTGLTNRLPRVEREAHGGD